MMWYVLICLCLSLAGVTGLQFFYLAYLEKINRERKKRLNELERHIKYLKRRIEDVDLQIIEKNKLLTAVYEELEEEEEEEVWADVIDER